jgi:hypothetical protein
MSNLIPERMDARKAALVRLVTFAVIDTFHRETGQHPEPAWAHGLAVGIVNALDQEGWLRPVADGPPAE